MPENCARASTRNTSGATVTPIRPREVELVVLHSLATLHMNRPDVARLARPVRRAACGGTRDAADLFS